MSLQPRHWRCWPRSRPRRLRRSWRLRRRAGAGHPAADQVRSVQPDTRQLPQPGAGHRYQEVSSVPLGIVGGLGALGLGGGLGLGGLGYGGGFGGYGLGGYGGAILGIPVITGGYGGLGLGAGLGSLRGVGGYGGLLRREDRALEEGTEVVEDEEQDERN